MISLVDHMEILAYLSYGQPDFRLPNPSFPNRKEEKTDIFSLVAS